jgi:hypothetical protein
VGEQLERARCERPDREHGDPHQAVRAVSVAARQPVHQPGEGSGLKAELPSDRAVRVIDVRQKVGARGEQHARDQV